MTLPGCPEVTTLFSTRAQRLPSEPNTRCYISGIHKLGTLHLVMFESIGHGVTIGSILQQIKQTVEEGGTFKSIFFTEISGSQINCFSFNTAANSIMVGNPQQLQSSCRDRLFSWRLLVTDQNLDAQLLTFKGVIFSPKSLICNVSRMAVCLFVTVIFLAKSL